MALASNALTTIAEMESILGLASGSADADLTRAINRASAISEIYCNRKFHRDTAISEKHTGKIGPILIIDRPPLNSLTSVTYLDGDAEDSGNFEIHDSQAGEIYRVSGIWTSLDDRLADASGTIFTGQGRKAWTIVYDGGWYTPKQEDDDALVTRNLPYDIEHAVCQIALVLYRNQKRNPSVQSETLMKASQVYAGSSTSRTRHNESAPNWLQITVPGAAMILDRYRFGLVA
jgi:hypothetical protein